MNRLVITLSLLISLFVSAAQANTFDHSVWNELLANHVSPTASGHNTVVDYKGMAGDREQLQAYLDQLATVQRKAFEGWPKDTQLAFLINVYNAWTVELILTAYPDLESIKDLGNIFVSAWKKDIVKLFDETWSLDNIEHDMIRGSGNYGDPRIHFAVNCASIGCPALRAEAYRGPDLEQQLQAQTKQFLADTSRNVLRGDTLYVSSIFKWYGEDFDKGWRGADNLVEFFVLYQQDMNLTDADVDKLTSEDITIKFLDYDWRLNDMRATDR